MIIENWQHLSDEELRRIAEGNAEESLLVWADHHLSEGGRNCKICNEKLTRIKKPEQ